MTVLVFGRSGQLARALGGTPGWRMVGRDEVDLMEPGAAARIVAKVRPAWVVNATAYTAVDRAESQPGLADRINGHAVGEMAAAATETGAGFLHVSTDYVFNGKRETPWREDDPPDPLGAYGRSKLIGEEMALAANSRTVILRTAWLFAPWGYNFVRTILRLGAEQRRLRVVDDQRGNPTSALDLARACIGVTGALDGAPAADPRWGIYHYAGRGAVSWAGFAHGILVQAVRRRLVPGMPVLERISTADYPTAAQRPANSMLDCTKFTETFGFAPRPWRDGLVEVMDRVGAKVTE